MEIRLSSVPIPGKGYLRHVDDPCGGVGQLFASIFYFYYSVFSILLFTLTQPLPSVLCPLLLPLQLVNFAVSKLYNLFQIPDP